MGGASSSWWWITVASLLGGVGYILQSLRAGLSVLVAIPFQFSFVLALLTAYLFLLFNAPAFFGENAFRVTSAITAYALALAFVFSQTRQPNPLLSMRTGEFVVLFGLAFAIGAAILSVVGPVAVQPAVVTTATAAVLVTYLLVVAISEELLFRFAIPSLIPGPRAGAQVVSAGLFAAFHWTAYDGNPAQIAVAGVLGLVFGLIAAAAPREGLVIDMGLHAAWNAYSLGFV